MLPLVALLLLPPGPQAPAPSPLALLPPGPHAVSITTRVVLDTTRRFPVPGDRLDALGPRPVWITTWRPAPPTRRAPVTLGDYVRRTASELRRQRASGAEQAAALDEMVAYLGQLGGAPDDARRALALPTLATAADGAPRGTGAERHPVVLLSPGRGESPLFHFALAEHLASHGYLVHAVPALGATGREMRNGPADLLAAAQDVLLLARLLRDDPTADTTRVLLVGYSFGSGAVLRAASGLTGVTGVLSLDGSAVSGERAAQLEALGAPPAPLAVPVLHLEAEARVGTDLSRLAARAPDCAAITIPLATHITFTSFALLGDAVPGMAPRLAVAGSARPAAAVYADVVTLVRAWADWRGGGAAGAWQAALDSLAREQRARPRPCGPA
ncbi:MAG: hypothetical protein NW201_14340 [Gemmatimonadales bacterium]|nr:hypothetical protein [Gemmatimonadales bacterium]